MTKKKTTRKSDIPFEQSLDQLKTIVSELEDGNLSLSDSLEKYEHGVKHLKSCYLALENAQKKIELLVDLDENGNLITRPFDDSATSQPTRKTTRSAASLDDVETAATDNEDEVPETDDIDDPDSLF